MQNIFSLMGGVGVVIVILSMIFSDNPLEENKSYEISTDFKIDTVYVQKTIIKNNEPSYDY